MKMCHAWDIFYIKYSQALLIYSITQTKLKQTVRCNVITDEFASKIKWAICWLLAKKKFITRMQKEFDNISFIDKWLIYRDIPKECCKYLRY